MAPAACVAFAFCLCSLRVAAKLPRANLLLLRCLLSLLHHISQKAESKRMHASNLAVCVGPNTLSPDTESVLPLDVQKAGNDKVC